ncbi:MAG: phage tail tube protein [Pseudomonadota bacterium]
MAKYHGRTQTLTFSDDSVGGIDEASHSIERAALDSTDHDDASRAFIPGRIQGTIDLTLKHDSGDAGQVALKDNIYNNTGEEAFVYTLGDGRKITGSGFVTSWNPSHPNDGVAMVSCTVQISGTITEAAV